MRPGDISQGKCPVEQRHDLTNFQQRPQCALEVGGNLRLLRQRRVPQRSACDVSALHHHHADADVDGELLTPVDARGTPCALTSITEAPHLAG